MEHAIEYAKAQQNKLRATKERQAKQVIKERKQSDRKRLEQLKSRSEWMRDCQAIFNKYIRLRDAGLPCISCGHPDDGSRQRHASHYRSVGAHPELRFNELGCHGACSICNNYLSGNLVPYRAALIDKIGIDKVEWLESKHEPLKLTVDEIKALIAEYKAKVKALTGQSTSQN
jgi:hypothetical protein